MKCKHVLMLLMFISAMSYGAMVKASCNKELINGWGIEWVPFAMGTQEEPSGFDLEMLVAIVKASGCTMRHTATELPWARRLSSIKNGRIDLAVGASKNADRKKWAYFTDAYRSEFIGVYIRQQDVKKYASMSIDDIIDSDFIMGGEFGNAYGQQMEAYLHRMGPERVHKLIRNEQNMGKLIKGRIDGYIGYLPVENLLIREKGYAGKIVMLPAFLIKTGGIHIMLSKKSNNITVLHALNDGLKKIKADGTYQAIVDKYSQRYQVDNW